MLLYPVTIVMLVLVLVRDKVKSVVPYRTAAAVTLGVSILDLVGNTLGVAGFAAVYQALPLSDLGFAWLIPAIVAFLIGLLFKGRKAEKDMCREMRMQHI